MSLSRIRQQFANNIEQSMKSAELMPDAISAAADRVVANLLEGGRIYTGGSLAGELLSQHFASLLLGQDSERPPLPALPLDKDIDRAAAMLRAFAQSNDVLLLVMPTPSTAEQLIQAARDRDVRILLLHGVEDSRGAALLNDRDIRLAIPGEQPARITESALLVLHALCDHIEQQLFGDMI
jgi:D-sedoheptulose 7-phosphate isomerase